jgi:hypothetical protein
MGQIHAQPNSIPRAEGSGTAAHAMMNPAVMRYHHQRCPFNNKRISAERIVRKREWIAETGSGVSVRTGEAAAAEGAETAAATVGPGDAADGR